MEKSVTIHVRVEPSLKAESEKIINSLGLNLSYAVSVFLKQVIIKKGIPFNIELEDENTYSEDEKLAFAVNCTGGSDISEASKKIIHLYYKGDIDYETAQFALERLL